MTITDTGPLVALLNDVDGNHSRCLAALASIDVPLLTTQACFTEAMYLLKRDTGYRGQAALWKMIKKQRLQVFDTSFHMLDRIEFVMEQYRDIPCDYADATLLALAEHRGTKRIFTFDSHFHAYRLIRGQAVEVLG